MNEPSADTKRPEAHAASGVAAPEAHPEAHSDFPPLDTTSPQLTLRAVLTGMVLGGVLSLCNIYSGLLIGWSNNMSVTAALLSYGFWQVLHSLVRTRPWGLLENNINQTAASAGASVSSAGLVAPIPALTILTGYEYSWPVLATWVFSVCLVGIVVAIGLRRQMLVVEKLPFPNGIATAETIKEMYSRGSEAMARVKALLLGAGAASALKIAVEVWKVPKLSLPGSLSAGGALASKGITSISMKNLTFVLDPSLLMVGIGALIGMRASVSLLLGAIAAWGVVTPYALEQGWAEPGGADGLWFGPVLTWLLWPGVAMMVTSSLTSFAFSWRAVVAALTGSRGKTGGASVDDTGDVPRQWLLTALMVVLCFSVITQVGFFGIVWWAAALGVLLTFVLAIVAGRVSGETGITPVGAMGKITQLTFGVLTPGNVPANLMAANVTGGAASQCADLLHDLKTGQLIGAVPRLQAIAQTFGALAGALLGSLGYLILIPNPKEQLFTSEWPAPAVASWKAVAELFAKGVDAMPPGATMAMIIAGALGVVLAIVEKTVPKRWRVWVPSPASLGLAFVINAYSCISMFIGAAIAWLLFKYVKNWAARFVIVIASGMVAGESITGVGIAIQTILASM